MAFLEYRTNLSGWWRADSLVTLNHGDDVLTWTDELNGYTLTGAAGATGKYQENQLNGRPAVLFDGINDGMTCSVNWSAFVAATTTNCSIIAVVKPLAYPTPTNFQALVYGVNAQAPSIDFYTDAGSVSYLRFTNYDGARQVAQITPYSLAWQILAWRHGASGLTLWGHRNDAYNYAATVATNPSTMIATPVTVGFGAATRYANLLLAELLFYNASLSANKVLGSVFADLMAKYFSPNDAAHTSPLIRGDGVEQERDVISRWVFARESRLMCLEWTGPLRLLDYQIGDDVYVTHPRGFDWFGSQEPNGPAQLDTPDCWQPFRVIGLSRKSRETVTLLLEPLS